MVKTNKNNNKIYYLIIRFIGKKEIQIPYFMRKICLHIPIVQPTALLLLTKIFIFTNSNCLALLVAHRKLYQSNHFRQCFSQRLGHRYLPILSFVSQ